MLAREDPGTNIPELVAVQIVGGHEHLVAIKKAQVNTFAIGGRRAGGPAVQSVYPFEGRLQNDLSPEPFSRCPVQANQIPGLFFLHRGDQVDPVAQDNGRGMPFSGQGNFPDQVLG